MNGDSPDSSSNEGTNYNNNNRIKHLKLNIPNIPSGSLNEPIQSATDAIEFEYGTFADGGSLHGGFNMPDHMKLRPSSSARPPQQQQSATVNGTRSSQKKKPTTTTILNDKPIRTLSNEEIATQSPSTFTRYLEDVIRPPILSPLGNEDFMDLDVKPPKTSPPVKNQSKKKIEPVNEQQQQLTIKPVQPQQQQQPAFANQEIRTQKRGGPSSGMDDYLNPKPPEPKPAPRPTKSAKEIFMENMKKKEDEAAETQRQRDEEQRRREEEERQEREREQKRREQEEQKRREQEEREQKRRDEEQRERQRREEEKLAEQKRREQEEQKRREQEERLKREEEERREEEEEKRRKKEEASRKKESRKKRKAEDAADDDRDKKKKKIQPVQQSSSRKTNDKPAKKETSPKTKSSPSTTSNGTLSTTTTSSHHTSNGTSDGSSLSQNHYQQQQQQPSQYSQQSRTAKDKNAIARKIKHAADDKAKNRDYVGALTTYIRSIVLFIEAAIHAENRDNDYTYAFEIWSSTLSFCQQLLLRLQSKWGKEKELLGLYHVCLMLTSWKSGVGKIMRRTRANPGQHIASSSGLTDIAKKKSEVAAKLLQQTHVSSPGLQTSMVESPANSTTPSASPGGATLNVSSSSSSSGVSPLAGPGSSLSDIKNDERFLRHTYHAVDAQNSFEQFFVSMIIVQDYLPPDMQPVPCLSQDIGQGDLLSLFTRDIDAETVKNYVSEKLRPYEDEEEEQQQQKHNNNYDTRR